jgi:hypothetical protein
MGVKLGLSRQRKNTRLSVSEKRVLRRIFRPKRDEVTGGWRKLHNSYSLPNIVRMIKSRRMTWAGHVARMGEIRNAPKILVVKAAREESTRKT